MFPNHEKRRFRCVTLEPFACSWSARIALISVFPQSTSSERCFLLVNLLYPTTLSSRKTRSKKSRDQENHKAERSPQRTTLWRYRGFTDGHERSEESRATSTPSPRIESAPEHSKIDPPAPTGSIFLQTISQLTFMKPLEMIHKFRYQSVFTTSQTLYLDQCLLLSHKLTFIESMKEV